MININVSWKSILLFWTIAVGLWAIATFADILILLFSSILLATFITPIVTALRWRGVPRWLSALFVYAILLGVFAAVVYLAAPLIIDETAVLVSQLPVFTAAVYDYFTGLEGFAEFANGLPSSADIAGSLIPQLAPLADTIRGILFAITGALISGVVVIVIAYFFIIDEQILDRIVQALVPSNRRSTALRVLQRSGGRMRGWVLGQLVVTVYFIISFTLGLWLIGVPYALSLGIITGFLEIIPFIGGATGAALAMIVAFAEDPLLVLWVLALHLVVSNVEAHILIPFVYSRTFRLHPAVVILALLVGAKLFGLVGAILSVPAAAALHVLIEELYIHDIIQHGEERAA